jgi:hypothetical protein
MEQTLHLPGHTGLSIAVVAVLSVAGMLLYFARVRRTVGPRDQVLLTVLRLVAVGGIVLAWLQPSWRSAEVVRRKPFVPVLVDESLSMGTRGASGLTRSEAVAAFFGVHRDAFDRLQESHDVRYFAFSNRVRPVVRDVLENPLEPVGGATDTLASIESVLAEARDLHLGGVIVVTDGIDNGPVVTAIRSGAALTSSDRKRLGAIGCPVFVFVPPDGPAPRDIAMDRLDGLDYVLLRDLAEIGARVRLADLPDGPVTVRLIEDGVVLDARTATTVGGRLEVPLHYLPRTPGRHVLSVDVTMLPDEATDGNNRRLALARVHRDRIRVLHVSGHASWDARFLREYLRRRRDVELVSFHTLRTADADPGEDAEQTTLIAFPAEELFVRRIEGFDLVILQDYELPEIDRARFAAGVVTYVQRGGALLFVSGGNSLGARGPWPQDLAPVLPIIPSATPSRGMAEGRFEVEPTDAGRRSPILSGTGRSLGVWPPLPAVTPVGGVTPDATVLLQTAARDAQPAHPLVVVAPRGQGRVGTLLTDSLWRWSFDAGAEVGYREVLDGMVAYLTRDPSGEPLQVTTSQGRLTPGTPQSLRVQAPDGVASVQVDVRDAEDPQATPLFAGDLPVDADGVATATVLPSHAGTYRVVAEGVRNGDAMRSRTLFLVTPDDDEIDTMTSLDRSTPLLAARTGGETRTLAAPGLDELPLKPEVVARVGVLSDRTLWDHPLVLLLLLGALGLEWLAERRLGYT